MTRLLSCLLPLLLAPSLVAAEPLVKETQAIPIGTRLELMVDDFLQERLEGEAALRLHKPQPQEVVLVTDKPWEGNTSAYYTVFRDDDRLRMYYRGSHFDEATKKSGHREVTCYAESRDGIHWDKPELGLFEFEGSKQNNIVWDGIGTHCFAVFKDTNPACEIDARYKAISRGRPQGKRGLYVFKSPDAIHWSLLAEQPVITTGAFDSQNLAFWDPHRGEYREYHRTFVNGVRAIMTSTSDDFVNWTKPVLLQYGDAPDQHLYTNAVSVYGRAPQIMIGFPTRYLPQEGQRVEPQFMSSRDGQTFHRWLEPIIPETAPQDRSGNRSNYMAWGVVALPGQDEELSVYATEAYYTGPDSRLRRFTYRVDGFVSLAATKQGGEWLSKPLTFAGSQLVINGKVGAGGSIRARLESVDGQPLATSDRFTGDATAQTLTWASGKPIAELAGQAVRLRFLLDEAQLFSFQFTP